MKTRSIAVGAALLILVGLTASSYAQETTKLKTIGRYTLIRVRGSVPTQEVMKTCVERYSEDIRTGFELAGSGNLYAPFIEQMRAASFKDTTLAVGDTVQWMLFRSRGQVKVARNVEWAGRAPLEVFAFTVREGDKIYEFIMPKPCGNIALRSVTEVIPEATCSLSVTPERVNLNEPVTCDMSGSQNAQSMTVEVVNAQGEVVSKQTLSPANPKVQVKFDQPGEYTFRGSAVNREGKPSTSPCVAKAYVNFPPVCKLWTSCMPCEDYVGRPIAFDLSSSSDPDGQITQASFQLLDAAGQTVDSATITTTPFLWEKVINKAGTYTIIGSVTDNAGAVTGGDACRLTFEVTQKRLYWLVSAGPLLAKGTYTTYAFLRGGLFYWLAPDQFSLVLSAGGGLPSRGDPWQFIFLANALAQVHAGPAFLGAGLGYHTADQSVRESGFDYVGNVGVDVFNRYTSRGSIFFEFRGPLGGDRDFDEYHKFALGFRLLF